MSPLAFKCTGACPLRHSTTRPLGKEGGATSSGRAGRGATAFAPRRRAAPRSAASAASGKSAAPHSSASTAHMAECGASSFYRERATFQNSVLREDTVPSFKYPEVMSLFKCIRQQLFPFRNNWWLSTCDARRLKFACYACKKLAKSAGAASRWPTAARSARRETGPDTKRSARLELTSKCPEVRSLCKGIREQLSPLRDNW